MIDLQKLKHFVEQGLIPAEQAAEIIRIEAHKQANTRMMALPYQNSAQQAMANALGQAADTPRWSLFDKLKMRLSIGPQELHPFDHLHVVENRKGGSVVVFMIVDGKTMLFEDDPNLFPTDKLVGQINLLRG